MGLKPLAAWFTRRPVWKPAWSGWAPGGRAAAAWPPWSWPGADASAESSPVNRAAAPAPTTGANRQSAARRVIRAIKKIMA